MVYVMLLSLLSGMGLTLAVDSLTGWYWTGNTVINSVAVGDVDGDGQVEIVTGGYFNDGVRNNAQLIEWNGSSLTVDRLSGWYWTGNTVINSVALETLMVMDKLKLLQADTSTMAHVMSLN